jgi:hypothetical protein
MVESGEGAKVDPAPPDSVARFMACFLLRIQDDSAVRNASVVQDKTLLGRGDILKAGGIICGR